jgi:cytochrome b561
MSAASYPKLASLFHWAVAIPLIGSVGSVLKAQSIPKEQMEEKMMWMHRHKSLGTLTGMIVLPRVGYRLLNMGKVRLHHYLLS